MTKEELLLVENELLSMGANCPYAPNEPSCQSDYDWQDAYFKFCSERLERLTLLPFVLNVAGPRESKAPGIQKSTRRLLIESLRGIIEDSATVEVCDKE